MVKCLSGKHKDLITPKSKLGAVNTDSSGLNVSQGFRCWQQCGSTYLRGKAYQSHRLAPPLPSSVSSSCGGPVCPLVNLVLRQGRDW